MRKIKNRRKNLRILLLSVVWLCLTVALTAEPAVIYENDFEAVSSAVDIGGNMAREFSVNGDPSNSWVSIFQHSLSYNYTPPIYRGATLSFDLWLPLAADYTGLLKAQAVTQMGNSWTWTQSGTIADISIDQFTDQGNGYKLVSLTIPFGEEIEAVHGLKAVIPCLAASNCDYTGPIYLDNVVLADGVPATPAPALETIFSTDFESGTGTVEIGGNKAVEYVVNGDINNSWVGVFQHGLYFEYTEKLFKGATLTYDILLPSAATYNGLLKGQAVTQMGESWTWTQANTIADIPETLFIDLGNGFKSATVAIAFAEEIEAEQGLKAIIPCLAASNCDYTGPVYLDNVIFENPSSGGGEELPPVEPILFSFDDSSSTAAWTDGGIWDYSGGIIVGYDAVLAALRLDLDYTASSTSGWSEAKVNYTFPRAQELEGYNQFSFDFIYAPANMTSGSFKAKIFSGLIDTNTSISEGEDIGGGLKKSLVKLKFSSAANLVQSFTLGIVGVMTDYAGPVFIDNVLFDQTAGEYVMATREVEEQTPVTISGGTITANGQSVPAPGNMRLVDPQATENTVKLAAYLDTIGKTGSVLFGHQNDTTHKAGNRAYSNSDLKDVTGSISAVVGLDTLSLTGNELSSAPWNASLEDRVAAAEVITKEAVAEGAVFTLSAHMPNFEVIQRRVDNSLAGTADPDDANSTGFLPDGSYNFSGYTPGTLSGNIVTRIMPGQDLNYLFTAYLDMIAAYAKALEDDGISILFRPFHECTGSWFWWGRAFCDKYAFRNLFRYTVEYLRDEKDVHNLLYVYGPGGEAESMEDYALRYPGDDYVDMVGFDCYHQYPAEGDNFIDQLVAEIAIVGQFAAEHNKLFAITETGVANGDDALLITDNARKDWYNEVLDAVSPSSASYFLVWANFGESTSFYTPYVTSMSEAGKKGHEMLDNFIDFYNDPRTVFAAEMPDYTLLDTVLAANTGVSGYFLSPVSGSRVLAPLELETSIRNAAEGTEVTYVATDKHGQISVEISAAAVGENTYRGSLSAAQLAELGFTPGTMSLLVDGVMCDTINLIYNIPEPVIDPTVVDTFDDYYGESDLLEAAWSIGNGTGCAIERSLSPVNYQGGYGLEFAYHLIPGGYAGIVKSMDGADWSSMDALRLWTIPDGRQQKVVVQVTSGSEVFEVYLHEYEAYTATAYPLLVTIPFSAFTGRDNPAAVFDATDIQSVGLWCNTIVPEGENPDTFTLDSVLYYDQIEAVASSLSEIMFEEMIPNRAPELEVTGSGVITEGDTVSLRLSATDPDGDNVVLSASSLPEGGEFDPESGIFTWTPDYRQAGEYTLVFTASDGELSVSRDVLLRVENLSATTRTMSMIQCLKNMDLDRWTAYSLEQQLQIVYRQLERHKSYSALAGVELFMLRVYLAGWKHKLSDQQSACLIEESLQLIMIIFSELPSCNGRERLNRLHSWGLQYQRKYGLFSCNTFNNLFEKTHRFGKWF